MSNWLLDWLVGGGSPAYDAAMTDSVTRPVVSCCVVLVHSPLSRVQLRERDGKCSEATRATLRDAGRCNSAPYSQIIQQDVWQPQLVRRNADAGDVVVIQRIPSQELVNPFLESYIIIVVIIVVIITVIIVVIIFIIITVVIVVIIVIIITVIIVVIVVIIITVIIVVVLLVVIIVVVTIT